MAINFPFPASSGDTYTGDNGVVYIYDGVKWIGSGSVVNNLVDHLHHGDMDFTLNLDGSVTLPLLLPKSFTAVLDTEHFNSQPGIVLTGTPWQFEVQYQVNPDGTVQTMLDQIFPTLSNPGYVNNHSFRFTEADHGIPDYVFDMTLNNVVLAGGAGWTANVSVTQPPVYPSSFKSDGAIKLTADTKNFIFGTDGNLVIPNSGHIKHADGTPYSLVPVGTGNFVFDGDNILMPLSSKLNNGGMDTTNRAEFGTNVTIQEGGNVATSQAYVVAGAGELTINMDDQFRTSVQVGVANANVGQFAGLIARDPFSQIGTTTNFIQDPLYSVSVGVMNRFQDLNGLFADEQTTQIHSGNGYTWDFKSDGDVVVPGQVRTAQGHRAVWSNEVPRDVSDLTDTNKLLATNNVQTDLNIDGGGAYAMYEMSLSQADGGFSSTRWGRNSTRFDGGLGAAGAGYTTTLNGGAA